MEKHDYEKYDDEGAWGRPLCLGQHRLTAPGSKPIPRKHCATALRRRLSSRLRRNRKEILGTVL
ncbi:MAG: hypothetical protein ACOYEL_06450 [Saccharofermentanales bacterium]